MFKRKKLLFVFVLPAFAFSFFYACVSRKTQTNTAPEKPATIVSEVAKPMRILVFTKTKGYYHQSIPSGKAAILKLAAENHFLADTTSDANYFNEDSLKNYAAVIFLSTTSNVLNAD